MSGAKADALEARKKKKRRLANPTTSAVVQNSFIVDHDAEQWGSRTTQDDDEVATGTHPSTS